MPEEFTIHLGRAVPDRGGAPAWIGRTYDAEGNHVHSSEGGASLFAEHYDRLKTQRDTLYLKVKEEVERLRDLQRDVLREIDRRRCAGLPRNLMAEGRYMTANATVNCLAALLEESGGEDRG